VHCSEPVARRDVGEIAGGQVAVGLEAVLHSKAFVSHHCQWNINGMFYLNAATYLVSFSTPQPTFCKKGKVTCSGGGESGDAKAAPSLIVLPRIRGCNILSADLFYGDEGVISISQTYHFGHLAILKTRSIVLEQSHTIGDGTESRDILPIPDDVVQLVVVGRLHASELLVSTEAITAELFG
jgi:hypothetical protein